MMENAREIIATLKFSSMVHLFAEMTGSMSMAYLLIIAVSGVVVAMFGYRIHKFVIIGSGMLVGALSAYFLYHILKEYFPIPFPDWAAMAVFALIFGGLAYGLFHSAIALMGAFLGAVTGWVIMSTVLGRPENAGYAVPVGIILGGAGAFLLKRLFVTVFSSLLGAYSLVLVIVVLIRKISPGAAGLITSKELIPLTWMLAMAALGFWFQYRRLPAVVEDEDKKYRRKKKAAPKIVEETDEYEDDEEE